MHNQYKVHARGANNYPCASIWIKILLHNAKYKMLSQYLLHEHKNELRPLVKLRISTSDLYASENTCLSLAETSAKYLSRKYLADNEDTRIYWEETFFDSSSMCSQGMTLQPVFIFHLHITNERPSFPTSITIDKKWHRGFPFTVPLIDSKENTGGISRYHII